MGEEKRGEERREGKKQKDERKRLTVMRKLKILYKSYRKDSFVCEVGIFSMNHHNNVHSPEFQAGIIGVRGISRDIGILFRRCALEYKATMCLECGGI